MRGYGPSGSVCMKRTEVTLPPPRGRRGEATHYGRAPPIPRKDTNRPPRLTLTRSGLTLRQPRPIMVGRLPQIPNPNPSPNPNPNPNPYQVGSSSNSWTSRPQDPTRGAARSTRAFSLSTYTWHPRSAGGEDTPPRGRQVGTPHLHLRKSDDISTISFNYKGEGLVKVHPLQNLNLTPLPRQMD